MFNRVAIAVVIVGAISLMLVGISYLIGARINTTRSIPVGLYWVSNTPIEKGAYVLFCPPQRSVFDDAKERGYISAGLCPGGYGYMMKRVLAAKNDVVSIGQDGVRVNEKLLPLSAPIKADGAGRPLPRLLLKHRVLDDFEVLLMSDVSAIGFDGRYFGTINQSQIKTVIRPIFTW